MRRLSLLLLLIPSVLAAQRDTTVCTAFRTRTSVNGSILSTSVTKVACGGAAKVDTVTIPGPVAGRDTLVWYPTITPTGDSLFYTLMAWRVGISPSGFRFPTTIITKRDTLNQYWALTYSGNRGIYGLATSIGTKPANFTIRVDTVVKRDSIIVIRVDTVRVPTPGPTPSGAPELPRGMAAMDSMIRASRAVDTMNTASWPHVRQDSTGKWVCYLNCTSAVQRRVLTMNAQQKAAAKKPKAAPKPVKPIKEPVG